jgi:ribulose-phosphate 3-epimerase
LVPAFVSAGADLVELHYEAMDKPKLYYWLDYLASNGVDAALAISPDTPVEVVEPYLPLLKQVLVMTVKPGFGGQSFLPESISRIKSVREIVGSDFDIEVDGGINDQTIKLAENAGANIFVVGSYLYENGDVGSQVHKLEKIIK